MYLEEFEIGQEFELKEISFSEEEIYNYAENYDPQPIHVDEEFANASIFNGIIASGFHTISAVWGEWVRTNRIGKEIIGGAGLDYLKWTAPVKPNDRLKTTVTVVEKKPSAKGKKGVLALKFIVKNQDEQVVVDTQARVIIKSKQ